MCEPRLLIADEPTTALDVTVQAGILRLIDRLRRDRALSVILITHDLGVMSALADDLAIFYGGRIVENGPAEALLAAPRHPYTRALLDALPHPETARGEPLRGIPGPPAQPGSLPSGCVFHPRCTYAVETCRVEVAGAAPDRRARSRLSRRPLRRMSALEIRDLEVAYERRGGEPVRAVVDASLSVDRGEIVGLVGESGCGKSTLARAAVGLIRPTGGTIVFEGRELRALDRGARSRESARLQMVFQNPYASLNPRRRIGRQIARRARDPRARGPRRAPAPGAGAARARRPSRLGGLAVPARVLGRPAAADRDRPGARRRPLGARARRAALVARRLRPGADREPPRRSLPQPRPGAAPHLPRPRDRPPGRRPRLRHVPRRDRRGGRDGRGVGAAAPPVHRGADPRDPASRRAPVHARGAAWRGARPRPAACRAAGSIRAARSRSTAARTTIRSWSRSSPAVAPPAGSPPTGPSRGRPGQLLEQPKAEPHVVEVVLDPAVLVRGVEAATEPRRPGG